MSKLDPKDVSSIATAAKTAGIEPARALAVTEVETGGRPFESADLDPSDGIEPVMLFERHRFYANLKKLAPEVLKEAQRQGLAIPKWLGPGSSQYADQKTSAGRLALIARAAALHAEAAYRSCSMGLFQIMGENHAAAGYDTAVAMHQGLTMGGIEAHIAAGFAFMRTNGLLKHLASGDWAAFAKGYNGTAYKKNAYDKKLADAYARWSTALRAAPPPPEANDASTLVMNARGPRVRALQESLTAFGVPVKADGIFGPGTRRGVAAAQVELGLPGDGVASASFVAKLEAAAPIAQGAREVATKAEVKEASFGARVGDNLQKVGGVGLATVSAYQGYLTQVQSGVDQLKSARDSVTGIVGEGAQATVAAWVVEHWQALLLAGGCATAMILGGSLLGSAIRAYRSGRLVSA